VVEALRDRALQITDEAPYFTYHSEPEWARVSLDGEEGVLHLCSADLSYDCPVFETQEVRFPAYLLFVSEKELHYWKTEEHRLYSERQSAERSAAAKQKEANERATYEALKRKFGQPQS